MSGYPMIDALNATHPLTPRENVLLKPSFGDVIENGWASEANPTRIGFFVREFTRTGRLNPGVTWEITDGKGKFWEFKPKDISEGGRLKVTSRTALASGSGDQLSKNPGQLKSGSGDHAELARLAKTNKAYGFLVSVQPETVLDLLAENAALRSDVDRMAEVSEQCSRWIAAHDEQSERASEAERKLAEAEGLVERSIDLMTDEYADTKAYREEARTFLSKEAERG